MTMPRTDLATAGLSKTNRAVLQSSAGLRGTIRVRIEKPPDLASIRSHDFSMSADSIAFDERLRTTFFTNRARHRPVA